MRKLRAAVIGAGFSHSVDGREPFGVRAVIPALKVLKDRFEIEAVCTSCRETAQESARHFGIRGAYWDYRRLLKQTDVEVVFVAVKPVLHFEIAMAALESGRHVYCEHPGGTSSTQALAMYRLARDRRLCTGIGHQHHHNAEVREMRRLIADGYIGAPLFFNQSQFRSNMIAPRPSSHSWITRVEAGGRSAFRAGHALERVISTLGDVAAIFSDMAVLVKERPSLDGGPPLVTNQSNSIAAFLRLKNGQAGVMHMCSTAWNHTGERLELYGSEGTLMLARNGPPRTGAEATRMSYRPIDGFRLLGKRERPGRRGASQRITESLEILRAPPSVKPGLRLTPALRFYGLVPAYTAFADAIEGRRPYAPGLREGLKLHRIFDALEKSSASMRWESVDYSGIR